MFLREVELSRRQWEDILKILCDKTIQNFCIEQKVLCKVRRDKLFQIKLGKGPHYHWVCLIKKCWSYKWGSSETSPCFSCILFVFHPSTIPFDEHKFFLRSHLPKCMREISLWYFCVNQHPYHHVKTFHPKNPRHFSRWAWINQIRDIG